MKFILWQDEMKQDKISFEAEHFVQGCINQACFFVMIELLFRLLEELKPVWTRLVGDI